MTIIVVAMLNNIFSWRLGWVTRGDISQPRVRRGVAMAMRQILQFLDRHVSTK